MGINPNISAKTEFTDLIYTINNVNKKQKSLKNLNETERKTIQGLLNILKSGQFERLDQETVESATNILKGAYSTKVPHKSIIDKLSRIWEKTQGKSIPSVDLAKDLKQAQVLLQVEEGKIYEDHNEIQRAFVSYKAAHEAKNLEGTYHLASLLQKNGPTLHSYQSEQKFIQNLAKKFVLSGRHHSGKETLSKEARAALVLYKVAAEKGHPQAQAKLGDYYRDNGIPFNAKFWYAKAAVQNDAHAKRELHKLAKHGDIDYTVDI